MIEKWEEEGKCGKQKKLNELNMELLVATGGGFVVCRFKLT